MSTRMGILIASISAVILIWVLLFVIPFPVHAQIATKTFSWTAPGDDGVVGTATLYTMKWSTARPDTTSAATKTSWWSGATPFAGMPVPLVAGTRQSATVGPTGGFTTGTTYYIVIRATDEAGNIGDFSNVLALNIPDISPPAPIVDLGVLP